MTTLLTVRVGRGLERPRWVLEELTGAERRTYAQIPAGMEYVPHPSFADGLTAEALFGEGSEQIEVAAWTQFPEVAEEIRPRRGGRASLGSKAEARLFLQYNFARYRLAGLIEAQRRRPATLRAKQMLVWFRRVGELEGKLVRANMALVLAMAKRMRIPNVEFGELVSEGNMALLRSVEKFDVSRGFKFSTYACRAILKSFHRLATNTGRYRQRFPTEFDPKLERSDYDVQRHDMQRDDSVDALREILARNRAALSEVERTVVMERFAIGKGGKGRTLSEVGKVVGLTNERVRQIQNVALAKIRAVLDDEFLVA